MPKAKSNKAKGDAKTESSVGSGEGAAAATTTTTTPLQSQNQNRQNSTVPQNQPTQNDKQEEASPTETTAKAGGEAVNNENDHDLDLTEESEQEAKKIKEKKHDSGAADLERVTDYAEEREINSSDLSGVQKLIATEMAGRLQKEKELQQIKIRKEDVELIETQLEISYEKAERCLREHGGNLFDTLETLTN